MYQTLTENTQKILCDYSVCAGARINERLCEFLSVYSYAYAYAQNYENL